MTLYPRTRITLIHTQLEQRFSVSGLMFVVRSQIDTDLDPGQARPSTLAFTVRKSIVKSTEGLFHL